MVNIMVKEYTWSDGSKYIEEFNDRKKHGQGTETLFTIGQPSSLVQISFSTRTF